MTENISGGVVRNPQVLGNFSAALFGWYCVMRKVAAPRALSPCAASELPVARSDRRTLSKIGLMHHSVENTRQRANNRVMQVVQSMKRRQVVIWMDNFYKRRYGVNPTCTDRSLNAAAMCVLHIPKLGRFSGHMPLKKLLSKIETTDRLFRAADERLSKWITDLISSPVAYGDIRSPLDMVRSQVRSPKWIALTLEDKEPGGQEDLLELIGHLDTYRQVATGQLPVLVDENIWWRIQKWMYGENYHKLSVQAGLKNFSFMYGVWHPYKFACMHLYRKFFDCFVYLERGSLPPGSQVVTHPKLAYVEKAIASLILVAPVVLPILDKEIDRVQAYWAGVLTRGNIYATRRVNEGRDPELERTWVHNIYATRRVNEAQRIRSRLDNLTQLRLLIGDYCAALFGVGCMVRECNWGGREYNTGLYARTALQWVFCILMRCHQRTPIRLSI